AGADAALHAVSPRPKIDGPIALSRQKTGNLVSLLGGSTSRHQIVAHDRHRGRQRAIFKSLQVEPSWNRLATLAPFNGQVAFASRPQESEPGGKRHGWNLHHRKRSAVIMGTITRRARSPSARAVPGPVRAMLVGETLPAEFFVH